MGGPHNQLTQPLATTVWHRKLMTPCQKTGSSVTRQTPHPNRGSSNGPIGQPARPPPCIYNHPPPAPPVATHSYLPTFSLSPHFLSIQTTRNFYNGRNEDEASLRRCDVVDGRIGGAKCVGSGCSGTQPNLRRSRVRTHRRGFFSSGCCYGVFLLIWFDLFWGMNEIYYFLFVLYVEIFYWAGRGEVWGKRWRGGTFCLIFWEGLMLFLNIFIFLSLFLYSWIYNSCDFFFQFLLWSII